MTCQTVPARGLNISAALALALAALQSGCGPPEPEPACAGSVPRTIAAFVPTESQVHCEDRISFSFEGRSVDLTHAGYGRIVGDTAGNFSSHLCALEDADDMRLLHANWYAPFGAPLDAPGYPSEDAPVGITDECPEADPANLWNTQLPCVPSGRRHPINQSETFRSFARSQHGQGPFGICFISKCYEDDVDADTARACFVGE